MKTITYLNKVFGNNQVVDLTSSKDEDDEAIEMFGIDENEDDSEPSYIVRVFESSYSVHSIGGDLLHTSNNKSDFKKYITKVLASNPQ